MVGRKEERARLKALLDAAREGRSGALLLHGPPGIGKTALLRYVIDEAQDFRLIKARGMESESDIPFAGRRLGQEGVVMIGAIRDDATRLEVPWLDRLRVEPLPDDEARALLSEELAPGVADRLVATAAGNPLALLEIPGLLSAGQRAGREPLEEPLRPGTGVERAFAVAIEALPEPTRRALLVASAAST